MNLIQAFDQKLVEGLVTPPDKIIETVVSRLYFYGDKVCKVYKYEKAFFGDFSSLEFRRNFYEEDFGWNHIMSPDIYLALQCVKKSDSQYKLANFSEAEDFYIEMKKIDVEKNLTNLILARQINENDLKKITAEMTLRIQNLTNSRKDKMTALFQRGWADLHREDIEDLRNLCYMVDLQLPKSKTDEIIDVLENATRENDYFQDYNLNNLSLMIDNHSDNIIFFNGKVEFIDILPPKENWRVGDPYFNICRPAVDVAVLWSEEKADLMYQTYEQIVNSVPPAVKTNYEIRSAMIQVSYFYMLNKPELAEKYLKFTEQKISSL